MSDHGRIANEEWLALCKRYVQRYFKRYQEEGMGRDEAMQAAKKKSIAKMASSHPEVERYLQSPLADSEVDALLAEPTEVTQTQAAEKVLPTDDDAEEDLEQETTREAMTKSLIGGFEDVGSVPNIVTLIKTSLTNLRWKNIKPYLPFLLFSHPVIVVMFAGSLTDLPGSLTYIAVWAFLAAVVCGVIGVVLGLQNNVVVFRDTKQMRLLAFGTLVSVGVILPFGALLGFISEALSPVGAHPPLWVDIPITIVGVTVLFTVSSLLPLLSLKTSAESNAHFGFFKRLCAVSAAGWCSQLYLLNMLAIRLGVGDAVTRFPQLVDKVELDKKQANWLSKCQYIVCWILGCSLWIRLINGPQVREALDNSQTE